MNSKSLSRSNRPSYSSRPMSLRPSTQTSYSSTVSQSKPKDRPTKKPSITMAKEKENQPLPAKAKPTPTLRGQKQRENMQEIKAQSMSITTKASEKESEPVMPLREIQNCVLRESTEKNVKDLNNSLANLALRRCVGRSSSDNDMLGYLTGSKHEGNQRSYTTFNQPADYTSPCSNVKTPSMMKRPVREFHTSVQKDYEVTPFVLQNKGNRESDRFQRFGNMRGESESLTISNVDYGKFQGGAYSKSTRPTQNMHYVSSLQDVQGRHLMTEGSYRMELSQLDNFNMVTEHHTVTPSHFKSNEMRLSDLHGDYIQDMGFGTSLRENQMRRQFSSLQMLNGNENDARERERTTYRKTSQGQGQGMGDSGNNNRQNFGYIPSFRGGSKGRHGAAVMDSEDIRRLSELPNGGGSIVGQLELNNISDGVEYTNGGVGQNRNIGISATTVNTMMSTAKKPRHTIRTKSSLTVTESKAEGLENVKKETVDSWKQEILRIKREMEMRKKSYAEVNKLARMCDEERMETSGMRKTSNMSSRADIKQVHFSGLRTPTTQESQQRRRMGNKKKISFEMKTTEDCDEQRSGLMFREEQMSPMGNGRAKTVPYYDFHNDTNEANNSFVYEDKLVLETAKKPPCCGAAKMCNMF